MSDETTPGGAPETPDTPPLPPPPAEPAHASTPEVPPAPPGEVATEAAGGTGAAAATKSKLAPAAIIAIVAVVLVAGAALAAGFVLLRGTGDVLVSKVPQDSIVYATAYLDPAAGQKMNLKNLLGKFPALQQGDVGKKVDMTMDEALSQYGMHFEQDVKPWLGSQVGIAVRLPKDGMQAGLLVATSDEGAAEESLKKMRAGYEGVTWKDTEYNGATISVASYGTSDVFSSSGAALVYTIVDGTVVLTDSEAFAKSVVDAANGDTPNLGASDDYKTTMQGLPKESLGVAYVNVPQVSTAARQTLDAAGASGGEVAKQLDAYLGVGIAVAAQSDGLELSVTSATDPSKLTPAQQQALSVAPHESSTVSWMPADSYGAVTTTGVGQQLQSFIEEAGKQDPEMKAGIDELGVGQAIAALSGDAGLEVSPGATSTPAGALLLGSKDDAAMEAFLIKVGDLAVATGAISDMTGNTSVAAPDCLLPGGGDPANSVLPPCGTDEPVVPPEPATWQTESYNGATIHYLSDPAATEGDVQPAWAVANGMAVVGSSLDEVKQVMDAKAGQNITTSPNYQSAIAHATPSNNGMIYANVEAIVEAARAEATPEDTAALDQAAPVKSVIGTVDTSPERTDVTVFVLIG